MNRLSVWFANTQVRNKILLGYGLILLFLIVIALVVAIQAERIQQQNVARERSESLWAASLDMSRAFASMNAALREFALMGDPRSLNNYEESLTEKQEAYRLAL